MGNFDCQKIQNTIGYTFKNQDLLQQAFTRSSYANENHGEDNEVLEFIGDSVLSFLITKQQIEHYGYIKNDLFDHLGLEMSEFDRNTFTCFLDESELSEQKIALVKRDSLASETQRMGLQEFLYMSKGDIKQNVQNNASAQEDLFEAILGAVTLDCNWNIDVVTKVLHNMLDPITKIKKGTSNEPNYEKLLNDWSQKSNHTLKTFLFNKGPSNLYICRILFERRMLSHIAEGIGKTEEEAKFLAQKKAWNFILKFEKQLKDLSAAIGKPNYDRAINQLQELWQKGLITEPIYEFYERKNPENSGNPLWCCECYLDCIEKQDVSQFLFKKKEDAKKQAAYEVLLILFGNSDQISDHIDDDNLEVSQEYLDLFEDHKF